MVDNNTASDFSALAANVHLTRGMRTLVAPHSSHHASSRAGSSSLRNQRVAMAAGMDINIDMIDIVAAVAAVAGQTEMRTCHLSNEGIDVDVQLSDVIPQFANRQPPQRASRTLARSRGSKSEERRLAQSNQCRPAVRRRWLGCLAC